MSLGLPRLHLRATTSTNDRAKELALQGAPHGTLVTADLQTAGRGRRGRTWHAPAAEALLMSLVLRGSTNLLPIAAAVAASEAIGPDATIKWPNDILVDDRKVAGILIERRAGADWTVLGIGINVAVKQFPPELEQTAGSLERSPADVELLLEQLIERLAYALGAGPAELVAAWRRRDALRGQDVSWNGGHGTASGVDAAGRLVVEQPDGSIVTLDAGEVELAPSTRRSPQQ